MPGFALILAVVVTPGVAQPQTDYNGDGYPDLLDSEDDCTVHCEATISLFDPQTKTYRLAYSGRLPDFDAASGVLTATECSNYACERQTSTRFRFEGTRIVELSRQLFQNGLTVPLVSEAFAKRLAEHPELAIDGCDLPPGKLSDACERQRAVARKARLLGELTKNWNAAAKALLPGLSAKAETWARNDAKLLGRLHRFSDLELAVLEDEQRSWTYAALVAVSELKASDLITLPDWQASDARLNRVYHEARATLTGADVAELVQVQRSWLAFRDAVVAAYLAQWPALETSALERTAQDALAKLRIAQLEGLRDRDR